MTMRESITIAVLAGLATAGAAGCRKDAPNPEHAPSGAAPASNPDPGPVGSVGIAPTPAVAPTPTTPTTPPAVAPPGTDRLVPVPAEVAGKLELVRVARGLARPVLLVVAPGDARKRLFVLEQHAGRVRILEGDKLLPRPFLTIADVSKANEQGLLGMAFHPKFATNRKLYVHYTGKDDASRIVEYQVRADNPDEVDPATRRELIQIPQPYSNHNGGHLVFGPDGKLWTGMGDGGSAGDPENNGQNPKALLGKMLRLDVDAAKPEAERVHLGVRNPWRFTFDAKTGDLYIADVGQNLWEYVFVVPAGATQRNFGWNVVEGNHCFRKRTCDRTGFTAPVVEYPHDEGCSITGGFVYRGKALPELAGRYFYADFCTGLLRSFAWTADPSSPTAAGWAREHWDWKAKLAGAADLSQVSSFGVDHDGELYVVELTGAIYKLVRK